MAKSRRNPSEIKKETSKIENDKDIEEIKEKDEKNKEQVEDLEEAEFIENLPPEAKSLISMYSRISGPMPNPMLSKINENHIDKILDIASVEEQNSYNDARQSRLFNLIYFIIIIALFIFLTIYLAAENQELFFKILTYVASLGGGFGGGYGYKVYKDSKKK